MHLLREQETSYIGPVLGVEVMIYVGDGLILATDCNLRKVHSDTTLDQV